MNAELVITGLCSMLNVDGHNKTMGDPSFIAVQTPAKGHPDHHVTYLAFESQKVQVDDTTGFKPVPQAKEFQYLEIEGVEISIAGVQPSTPTVLQSYYDKIVRKDDYWPAAKDQWNRDYVPTAGNKPKKSAVKAFMRFGKGEVSASRISQVKWKFAFPGQPPGHEGNFAEEVVYGKFPIEGQELVITLHDLDDDSLVRELRFTLLSGEKLTLIIGNNDEQDIAGAVNRRVTVRSRLSDHFRYLNRVADSKLGNGPVAIPDPISPPAGNAGAGENTGPCGPGNGNN
jgi:hypothetical protein